MQVVCGGEHTMVICQQGRVFSWGRGNCGQTGLGTTDTVTLPARLEALEDHCATQVTTTISSTHQHAASLVHNSILVCKIRHWPSGKW